MNRGQTVKLTYLNSAVSNIIPSIGLAVSQKGVKLKFRLPQKTILDIPQPRAALIGIIIGLIIAWGLISTNVQLWAGVILALIYGLIAQLPGAYIIKIWRKFREIIGS